MYTEVDKLFQRCLVPNAYKPPVYTHCITALGEADVEISKRRAKMVISIDQDSFANDNVEYIAIPRFFGRCMEFDVSII